MATVNNRLKKPQAVTINAVAAGGSLTAQLQFGYEIVTRTDPDGLEIPIKDREVQFVRGSIVTQDWIHAIDLLTGAVGTLVFYERNSGVAAATGYTKHTITNPVIHRFAISISKGGYATCAYDFECKAADETKTIADMWVPLAAQAAPTYVDAARGGVRIESAAHGGSIDIYHSTGFDLSLAMNLVKACNDSDIGYTCVDAELNGMSCNGSISYQDGSIATAKVIAQQLVLAARASLVVTVRQSGGATSKTITIAGVTFDQGASNSDVNASFTEYSSDFEVGNDTGTPLTLEGDNKIIVIANAA